VALGISVVNIDKLSQIIQSAIGLGKTGEVVLAFRNEAGEVKYPVARRFDDQSLDAVSVPMLQALAGVETVFFNIFDYRQQKAVAVSSYVDDFELGLVAKIDNREIMAAPIALLVFLIFIFLTSVVFYFFITQWITQGVTESLSKLSLGAKEIGRGNWDYRVGLKDRDEIGELFRAFNQMSKEVRKSRAEVDRQVAEQTKEIQQKIKR